MDGLRQGLVLCMCVVSLNLCVDGRSRYMYIELCGYMRILGESTYREQ